MIKTKQNVFASVFVWLLVSEIWYAHFWYGFIKFSTHCSYQRQVIIYIAISLSFISWLYITTWLFFSNLCIHFLNVKPKINQIIHGWATFFCQIGYCASPTCTALNNTALLYMQWGNIIYDEVLLFYNCTKVPSFSKYISTTFIVLWGMNLNECCKYKYEDKK